MKNNTLFKKPKSGEQYVFRLGDKVKCKWVYDCECSKRFHHKADSNQHVATPNAYMHKDMTWTIVGLRKVIMEDYQYNLGCYDAEYNYAPYASGKRRAMYLVAYHRSCKHYLAMPEDCEKTYAF